MPLIYGDVIDQETRCIHYAGELDIIALKCFSCKKYYPCYHCHDAHEDHAFAAYPVRLEEDKVVFCGSCRSELTIAQYLADARCIFCRHPFNPGCKQHRKIYFRE